MSPLGTRIWVSKGNERAGLGALPGAAGACRAAGHKHGLPWSLGPGLGCCTMDWHISDVLCSSCAAHMLTPLPAGVHVPLGWSEMRPTEEEFQAAFQAVRLQVGGQQCSFSQHALVRPH